MGAPCPRGAPALAEGCLGPSCAALGQAGLETTAEAEAPAPSAVYVLSLSVSHRCVTDRSSRP